MKKLSDYKDDEAVVLWGELIEPIMKLIADDEVQKIYKSGKPKVLIATEILKVHPAEVSEILLRIDPTPLNGLNIVSRFIEILVEISKMPELASFFGSAEQSNQDITM